MIKKKNNNESMAELIEKEFKLDELVKKAFLKTDRGLFIPEGFSKFAYELNALPIKNEQWISSPLTVAKLTQFLDLKNADSVLEIGLGSGYQAAILSKIVRRVFSIERVEKLIDQTRIKLKSNGITNVNIKLDDGQNGWKEFAPFDRILFSASAKEVPKDLFNQLNDGGILIAPIEISNKQVIIKFTKNGNSIKKEELFDALFVKVLDGIDRGAI